MYELLVKLEKDLEYKKYTIEDLEEIKEILKNLTPSEVKLKRIELEEGERKIHR